MIEDERIKTIADHYGLKKQLRQLAEECSEAIGLSKQSILKHINQGTADRMGRTYDYPLEEEE